MHRCLSFLLAVIWLSPGWASTDSYGYSVNNKYLATVIGTPRELRATLPEKIPLKRRSITIFEDRKALLINPPVRLYSSISLLDRMLENIPGGIDNFPRFYDQLVEQLTRVYKRSDSVDIGEDFLFQAFEAVNPDNEELAALIGVSFRISSANMAYTSDVMTDFGYIKPPNITMRKNSSTFLFNKVSHRLGFTDFYHVYFYPYHKAQDPTLTRSKLIHAMSLASIEDYLRDAEKIEVMHNRDDIILEPGEIAFFQRVFGTRAKIYPRGGHCGNMDFKDNVAYMVNVFKQ